jgi:hypothetical protein
MNNSEADLHLPATAAPLLAQCLRAAATSATLTVLRCRAARSWERGLVDASLDLRVDGQRARFAVATRTKLAADAAVALRPLQRTVESHGSRLLVCTRRATRNQVEQLRGSGISLVDTAGTVSLQAPGLRIHCLGKAPAAKTELRRTTGTDARILHVLMRQGEARPPNQRLLARSAGVSLGAVGTALRALEARGVLHRRGATAWVVSDLANARDRFLEGWTTVVRRKLNPQRCRAIERDWTGTAAERIGALAPDVLLGGELAAMRLGASLVSDGATLHVTPARRAAVMRGLHLLLDAQGPITVLDRFGEGDAIADATLPYLQLAHPLLVHAELAARGDERLSEAMAIVWQGWLAERGGG